MTICAHFSRRPSPWRSAAVVVTCDSWQKRSRFRQLAQPGTMLRPVLRVSASSRFGHWRCCPIDGTVLEFHARKRFHLLSAADTRKSRTYATMLEFHRPKCLQVGAVTQNRLAACYLFSVASRACKISKNPTQPLVFAAAESFCVSAAAGRKTPSCTCSA